MKRTGVFGSAFNPPTRGHLDVIQQAASEFEHILLVPSAAHAFNKQSLSLEARAGLLAAFCEDMADIHCSVTVSLVEQKLHQEKPDRPVYTWTLLNHLSQQNPDTEFSFIRGPDNAAPETWQRFYRHQEISERWNIFTARENIHARSTLVRKLLQNCNESEIPEQALAKLVTPSVLAHLKAKNLYR
ncbi:adenylyltransferase/cytidyltransferase family protein [Sansalvadorimonas verongulae]|uniref:adenylyltransferase/cytidyltransferase family protein n=1 Tax=Sansalvadorimonas verongulae TaxID=2172824 RepID=UPI0012BC4E1C|nr:adenylyltransferase/cytidyltransferase family protein [Sansalvadorimonas verongulae]MTI15309.1 nicotinate-nicotinamide nucleotide adenylyltransferase [Sansalvadorimonas verongulae]